MDINNSFLIQFGNHIPTGTSTYNTIDVYYPVAFTTYVSVIIGRHVDSPGDNYSNTGLLESRIFNHATLVNTVTLTKFNKSNRYYHRWIAIGY